MASLSKLAPMASLSKPNGNFIKAPKRPFYRRLSNGHFIKAKPNGEFTKANTAPRKTIAVSSRQAVTTLVYRSQWPLYQSQWPFYQGRPILAKEEFRGKNLWV